MGADPVSTAAVDYLQRVQMVPALRGGGATVAPLAARRLVRVVAVGQPTRTVPPPAGGVAFEPPTLPLLVGLAGAGTPVAFLLEGHGQGVSVRLGTWADDGTGDAALDAGQAMLLAVLDGSYPVVDIAAAGVATPKLGCGAFGMGVPSPAVVDPRDGALPIDRLVRSMTGLRWAALVLAAPVGADWLGADRNGVLNEMRAAATAVQATGLRSPLGEHYLELLQARLEALAGAQARGGWRTAVYLLGPGPTELAVLASAWRAVFSGANSVPEPVRTVAHPAVVDLAAHWALPDDPERPGPGNYRHPFAAQTLLSSTQLAAYLHLPALETPGFGVRIVPRFDTVPVADAGEAGLAVGRITRHGRDTGADYRVSLRSLTRHVFVSGVTGSGKTNTIFSLLAAADAAGVPFLVIEPAKSEYRAMLDHPVLGGRVRVFTLGDEMVSPFRLNPFEVPEGIPVAVHLDLLRSVFSVSFGMWTPLPQVIEICLHRVYADRGWDITSNSNRRLDDASDRSASFPTLTDLVAKVDLVTSELGYEQRITADIRAALRTRLNSLRTGGKGRMLDTSASLPLDLLLGHPTVLELESLGDDDDKAFVMGLILIRLAEHRRVCGDSDRLQHLLVVEEAHRLLGHTGSRRDAMEADVRGKAVETFTNLLSEVRAYGQGVIVVEQVPAKLAPDVVKNTNLKVTHRIVAGDDRAVLASAMAMDALQQDSLATLSVGQAAVFTDGEDAPLLVQVPRAKGGANTWPSDDMVRQTMVGREALQAVTHLFLPSSNCDQSCREHPDCCELARRLLEDDEVKRTLSRIVLSAILTPDGLRRTWPELVELVEARCPPWIGTEALLRSVLVHGPAALAAQRGAGAGWTYADTRAVSSAIRLALEGEFEGRNDHDSVAALRALLLQLRAGQLGPFLGCRRIWGENDGRCLCRDPVAELVASRAFDDLWTRAAEADRTSKSGGRPAIWSVCQDAAYHLVEFPRNDEEADIADVARRFALCFGQQVLATRPWSHPRTQRRALEGLIAEAGHPAAVPGEDGGTLELSGG